MLLLWFSSPNAYGSQVWALPKPKAKNSMQFSHTGGQGPDTWTSCCSPKRISRKADQKRSRQDLFWLSHVECRHPKQHFNPLYPNTCPKLVPLTLSKHSKDLRAIIAHLFRFALVLSFHAFLSLWNVTVLSVLCSPIFLCSLSCYSLRGSSFLPECLCSPLGPL